MNISGKVFSKRSLVALAALLFLASTTSRAQVSIFENQSPRNVESW